MKPRSEHLYKEIQLAVLSLAHHQVGNSIRGESVHIDDIRTWVEQRNLGKWSAETITRQVRKMREQGLLEGKDGMYQIRRG